MADQSNVVVGLAREAAAGVMPPAAEMDKENAFLLYATFCADVERTAHALNIEPAQVLDLVDEGKWNDRLRGILELKKSGNPGDIERAVNRALNFVQAHRFRLLLESVLRRVCAMPISELDELLITVDYNKAGIGTKKFSTRPLADLAAALEKAHQLTYLALNDSTTERRGRDDVADSRTSGGELHAQIAKAMAEGGSVTARLNAGQDAQAK
jgi:hypothetical protein